MSRLTERDGRIAVRVGGCTKRHDPVFDKLAHYEDLEEAGRLITLPCKVGDTIFEVLDEEEIIEYKLQKNWRIARYLEEGVFGTYAFTTKAEAERKLAEPKGGAE